MPIRKIIALTILAVVLAGCEKPDQIVIPPEPDKWGEVLKPAMKSLDEDDRKLLTNYLLRVTMSTAMRGEKAPTGITVADALARQRQWVAAKEARDAEDRAAKEAARVVKEAQQAKAKAMAEQMRNAVSVSLASKSIKEELGSSGRMVLDEALEVTFAYKNNSGKAIKGVKGTITINDMFGDKLSAFAISNDKPIEAGGASTWTGSRSLRFGLNGTADRKFAALGEDAYTVIWEPAMIIFSDGSSLPAQE